MFDVNPQELLLLGAVAVAVIPPKDLPRAMRFVGQWIGKARGMARHFRSGLDEMIRQAELDEIEKKWREENERIMREHPLTDTIEQESEPAALPAPSTDMIEEPAPVEALAEAAPPIVGPEHELPSPPAPDVAPVPAAEPASEPPMARARAPRPPKPVAMAPETDGPELPLGLPPKP